MARPWRVRVGGGEGGFGVYCTAMSELEPHLLVVDDDARLRDLLRRYLSENGFRVTVAANAAEARANLASFAFDLIVLDVMMPGESGLDLTLALRQTEDREPRLPVLLLTAMAEPELDPPAMRSGACGLRAAPNGERVPTRPVAN